MSLGWLRERVGGENMEQSYVDELVKDFDHKGMREFRWQLAGAKKGALLEKEEVRSVPRESRIQKCGGSTVTTLHLAHLCCVSTNYLYRPCFIGSYFTYTNLDLCPRMCVNRVSGRCCGEFSDLGP